MKVTVTLTHPKSYDPSTGITTQDKNVTMGSCVSEPRHRMDTVRAIHTTWHGQPFDKNLQAFKDQLKTWYYENPLLEIEIIDKR